MKVVAVCIDETRVDVDIAAAVNSQAAVPVATAAVRIGDIAIADLRFAGTAAVIDFVTIHGSYIVPENTVE